MLLALLVLLAIFMIIPRRQKGLDAMATQPAAATRTFEPGTIAAQVVASGELRINQHPDSGTGTKSFIVME